MERTKVASEVQRCEALERQGGWSLGRGGASAVNEPGHFEVRKSSSRVKSPGVPDAAKGSPDLSDLIDLHCT